MTALTSSYRNVMNMVAGGLMWPTPPLTSSAPRVVPESQFSVTQCVGKDALAPHIDAIADLSARALEPNPFYEPWLLSSALRAVVDREVAFVLIFKTERSSRPPALCGFFPVIPSKSRYGLPLRTWRLLSHMYCSLGVPLVDRDASSEVLQQFFSVCRSCGVALVEFPLLPSGGAFHQALVDVLHQQQLTTRIESRYLRALYRAPASPSRYLGEALSGRSRKHVRRQRERLAEMGALEYSRLETTSHPEAWLREFLDLEAMGWKGKANTAIASAGAHRQFFMEAAAQGLERRKIFGAALRLDGRMIAGRIGFRSAEGSYLFKIAYDERLAAFSPGTLLELQAIEKGLPEGVEWTDSCTSATTKTFRTLWLQSRIIEHLVVSPGSIGGDLAIGLIPLLRRMRSRIKRGAANAHSKEGSRVSSIE